ncbi:MAG TPA: glutamine amidotransferase, partial [Phycisphaerae bacterium]|nr:glutamine amidotransferase [Phycisphaerae bacterium]
MLAMGETRLLFYSEGLAMTGYVTAVVGAVAFVVVLLHGAIRAVGSAEGDGGKAKAVDPILPMWQVTVGLALAALVFLMAWAAAGDSGWQTQMALMGLVALACGVWVLFFYLRVFNYLGRLPMAGLLAMRLLAILLLVLLIFKPVLSFEETLEHRTDLYLLVDASESMSVSDYPDTPHRLSLAARQVEEYLGRLQTAFEVKRFWFDTRAHEVEQDQWPSPEGDATNLTRAVKDVLAAAQMIDTSGIILMSDGLHNAGGDVVKEITALGPPRIYTVGIGTDLTAQSGYQDISIEDIRAPEESTVNNIAKITVDVEAVGLADRGIQVELRENDAPLASAPLRLDSVPGSQSVTLTFTPETLGRHTYSVRIRPDPAERRSENNERDVHLLVTDPKIRVLYVEGVVRPEYKPLKSVLETDPNVEVLALVQVKRGEFLQSGSMTGVSLTGFPQTLEDMRKFDVYIVGDLDRSYFSRQQLENLKTAISEGRGVVMIGGYSSFGPGGYEGTAMEEILPVAVGPRSIGQETTPFVLKLTPEGANHPIFYGTRDFFRYQSDTPRQQLPYLKGCNVLARAKPGASILAEHPERTNENGPLTVLAVHNYGKGRAAAFAADTTYQWYLPFKALGRESPYIKFWGQMVRWLANKEVKEQSDKPGVDLLVRKPYY